MLLFLSLYVKTNCFCVCLSPKSLSSSCCLTFQFARSSINSIGALERVFLFPLVVFKLIFRKLNFEKSRVMIFRFGFFNILLPYPNLDRTLHYLKLDLVFQHYISSEITQFYSIHFQIILYIFTMIFTMS